LGGEAEIKVLKASKDPGKGGEKSTKFTHRLAVSSMVRKKKNQWVVQGGGGRKVLFAREKEEKGR